MHDSSLTYACIGLQDAGWGGLLFAIVDMEACGTGAQNRWSGESWCATDAYSPSLRVLFTPPAKAATPQKAALADITSEPKKGGGVVIIKW